MVSPLSSPLSRPGLSTRAGELILFIAFAPLTTRNWSRQSSIQLFYDIIHGELDPSTVFADEP